MRTFVAIEIDDWLRGRLVAAQEELKRAGAQVRWVAPENIHLTVKFLGDTPDALLSEVSDRIKGCLAGIEPFAMRVEGVGAFPEPARARVVVVRIEAPEALYTINGRLEEAAEALGLGREERRYTPHLTLGRVKGPKGRERLAGLIAEMAERPFGEVEAAEVVFMMSELSPGGARYTPLARFALGGEAPRRT